MEQILSLRVAQRPIVVLAAAVDARKWLFVQKTDKTMTTGKMTHHIHGQHIVVTGRVGIFVDRGQFKLTGGHLVVSCLARDTKGQKFTFQVLHKT